MITVISGTDRKDGLTHVLAQHYADVMQSKTGETVKILFLEDIPIAYFGSEMYKKDTLTTEFIAIEIQRCVRERW